MQSNHWLTCFCRARVARSTVILTAISSFTLPVWAQTASQGATAAITVTARPIAERVMPPQVELSGEALIERQASTIADVLRGLVGVSARTNSRGETIARVRGADERQTAVFFDGAPLSVPWDGRVDIGILPAGLIGRVAVTKGAVPIEFGANAVGGVVDLQSRRGSPSGRDVLVTAEAGSLGYRQLSAVNALATGQFDITIAGGHLHQDAAPVADFGQLPFSQRDQKRRTNTELDSNSGFLALGTRLGRFDTRLSVLHNESERGIAPESDRDPAVAAPRYWRYPDINLTQATLNMQTALGDGGHLSAVLYRQWFDQTIDNYRTVDYASLSSRQQDDDNTLGGRVTVDGRVGAVHLRMSGSWQIANHKQVDTAFPSGVASPRLEFEQRLGSLGVEADFPVASQGKLTLSAAMDQARMPLTGDKPSQPSLRAPAISAAFQHRIDADMQLMASIGRRTRFPSARELFGEALGRFLINPDLQPEKAWLADVEWRWTRPGFALSLNPFYARGTGTISQRMVRVDNVNRRQRFNLSGTRTVGVDGSLTSALSEQWTLAVAANVSRALADAGDAPFRRLVQRPMHEISTSVTYRPSENLSVIGQVLRTGRAEDDSPILGRVTLPASTEFSLRAKWLATKLAGGTRLSLTAAGDNLTNANVLPQLGLPRPGRMLRIGILID